MANEIDPRISYYTHLRDKPREKEALHMLKKIASLVKPIMRQRGWRVGTLSEFYPPTAGRGSGVLLGEQ
jgi:DNA-dependent metalloprotease WSS1